MTNSRLRIIQQYKNEMHQKTHVIDCFKYESSLVIRYNTPFNIFFFNDFKILVVMIKYKYKKRYKSCETSVPIYFVCHFSMYSCFTTLVFFYSILKSGSIFVLLGCELSSTLLEWCVRFML